MGQGRIIQKGVFPPEAAVEPLEALKLADLAIKALGIGGGMPITIEHVDKDGKRSIVELQR